MDGWDILLLAITTYIAVAVLAQMMRSYRDATLARLRQQFEAEQQRIAAERKREERAERKRKQREEKLAYIKQLEEKQRGIRAA